MRGRSRYLLPQPQATAYRAVIIASTPLQLQLLRVCSVTQSLLFYKMYFDAVARYPLAVVDFPVKDPSPTRLANATRNPGRAVRLPAGFCPDVMKVDGNLALRGEPVGGFREYFHKLLSCWAVGRHNAW